MTAPRPVAAASELVDDWIRRQVGVPTAAEAEQARREAEQAAAENAARFREVVEQYEETRARALGLPDPRVPVTPQSPDHALRAQALLNSGQANDMQAALRATDPRREAAIRQHAGLTGPTSFDGGARGSVAGADMDELIRGRADRNFKNRNG